MSDNTMPERIIAGYGFHGYEWSLPESVMAYRLESVTEYIRANIAQAQLAERENAVQREVYVERMRADGLRNQLDAANARIAELEEALRECADDLESEVNARYAPLHPAMEHRHSRDMEPVRKARSLLHS